MNTIGYVELAYALTTGMDYAFIENREGTFIEPSLASTRAAVAASAATLPKGDASWSGVSMTNAPGAESYPIASFSYLLLYKELSTNSRIDSLEKARALVEFVDWAITDGQAFAEELEYVPLPDEVVTLNKETLASLTFNGQPVMDAEPGPTPTEEPFTISSSLDGTSYTITGRGANASATGFSIDPQKSIQLQVEGEGDFELTLPKTIISGIPQENGIMAGGEAVVYEIVDETATDTVVRVTVPEGEPQLEIMGTFVVPEFGLVAIIVLAGAIVGLVGLSRLKGNALGIGFGRQV
jgi:phosphate transport system permease protein/phosphate transport system substrate-binding protein